MGVKLEKLIEKMSLKNLTPDLDLTQSEIQVPISIVRHCSLRYFDHFDSNRVQIIGYVEYTYLETLSDEKKKEMYTQLLSYGIPCIVYCRNLEPDETFLQMANEMKVPIFQSSKQTSAFTAEVIRWLNVELAPCISIHGVLLTCTASVYLLWVRAVSVRVRRLWS